ncbi:MAG: hypothetical protein EOP34_07970, partial [Rickettsiales bacterium]
MNKYNLQKNYRGTKITTQNNASRKSRTRTLIQLGGLIDKAGITKLFDIDLGDDLQSDTYSREKAISLLGFLIESI